MSASYEPKKSKSPIADRLREMRKASGLSLDQAARQAGVSYNTLRSWERDRVPLSTSLPALADAYGCSIDQLLGRGPTPGCVLVDKDLVEKVLSLTPTDGEEGMQALTDQHGHGAPFNWVAVVPEHGVWMTREDAANLREQVLSHFELVAPNHYRKWIKGRSSYTSRPKK